MYLTARGTGLWNPVQKVPRTPWKWGDPCPGCKATSSVRQLPEALTCTACGMEVEDFILDETPEWRVYDDPEDAQKVRADAVLPDKYQTKTIQVTWETLQQVLECGQKNLSQLFATARGILSKYMEHNKLKTLKGEAHRKSLMGAAVHVSANRSSATMAYTLSELAAMLQVPESKLQKSVTALQEFEKQHTLPPLETHIRKFVYGSASIPPNLHWEVIKRCYKIEEKIRSASVTLNCQPQKMAATLISIVVEVMNIPNVSIKTIAEETNTSVTTFNKLRKALLARI